MSAYLDEAIALVLIIGCFILLAFHIDGEVKSILTMAAGYVFGKRISTAVSKRGKNSGKG